MKTSKKPESFIRSPNFIGGDKAMDLFVKEHLKYPEEAIRMKIAGTVAIIADVDFKGHVIKTVVKKGIGFGCDEEAARVVALMKFEGLKHRGMRVVFHKSIQIHFKIPGVAEINPTITYSYIENKPATKPASYSYKIGE